MNPRVVAADPANPVHARAIVDRSVSKPANSIPRWARPCSGRRDSPTR